MLYIENVVLYSVTDKNCNLKWALFVRTKTELLLEIKLDVSIHTWQICHKLWALMACHQLVKICLMEYHKDLFRDQNILLCIYLHWMTFYRNTVLIIIYIQTTRSCVSLFLKKVEKQLRWINVYLILSCCGWFPMFLN